MTLVDFLALLFVSQMHSIAWTFGMACGGGAALALGLVRRRAR